MSPLLIRMLNNFMTLAWGIFLFLRDVFLLLVLPLEFMMYGPNLPVGTSWRYLMRLIHKRFHAFVVYGVTVRFGTEDRVFGISVYTYDDFLRVREKELKTAPFHSRKEFFRATLKEAWSYRWIIYSSPKTEQLFIQLRTDGGAYMLDIPLTPKNLNADYAEDVLALLRKRSFRKAPSSTALCRLRDYTIYEMPDDLTVISVDFGRNRELAVDMAEEILHGIYGLKTRPSIGFG